MRKKSKTKGKMKKRNLNHSIYKNIYERDKRENKEETGITINTRRIQLRNPKKGKIKKNRNHSKHKKKHNMKQQRKKDEEKQE